MKTLFQHLTRFSGRHIPLSQQLVLLGLFDSLSVLKWLHWYQCYHRVFMLYAFILLHSWRPRVEPLPAWYRWVWEEYLVCAKLVDLERAITSLYGSVGAREQKHLPLAYHPYRDTLQAIEHRTQRFWRMRTQVHLAEVEAAERQLHHLLMCVKGETL